MASLISDILAWAPSQPTFDTSFVLSVQRHLQTRGRLTAAQETALRNIYDRYKVGRALAEARPARRIPTPPPTYYGCTCRVGVEDEPKTPNIQPSMPYTLATSDAYWKEHRRLNNDFYQWCEDHHS